MAKRSVEGGRKLVRAVSDELGLTTPKTARRRTPARVRKRPATRAARQGRR